LPSAKLVTETNFGFEVPFYTHTQTHTFTHSPIHSLIHSRR